MVLLPNTWVTLGHPISSLGLLSVKWRSLGFVRFELLTDNDFDKG